MFMIIRKDVIVTLKASPLNSQAVRSTPGYDKKTKENWFFLVFLFYFVFVRRLAYFDTHTL